MAIPFRYILTASDLLLWDEPEPKLREVGRQVVKYRALNTAASAGYFRVIVVTSDEEEICYVEAWE